MEEAGQTPGALPQMTTVGDVRKLLGATAEGLAAEYAAKLVKAKVAEDVSSQQYAAGKDAPQLYEQLRDAHAEMLPAELLASQNPGLRPGRPVAAEPAAAGTGGGGASEEPQLLQTSQGSYTEEGSGTCDTSKDAAASDEGTATGRRRRRACAGRTARAARPPTAGTSDQCPPTLHPRTEEAFCSMFAVMWWNGIQVCTTNLERWKENSQRNWVLERSLPSFIDVWYHGFGANPVNGESPPRNNRVNIAEGQGVLRGNPVSIVMNKAMVFMTQSRDTGVLHRTFRSQKHPAWTGIGGWGWETIQSLAGFFTIYVSVEHPLYESEWVHWSMASGSYNSQLVFTHDIGSVPARVGVFFSAQCSDNDPYISVARYSGRLQPEQIEVNKKQVVLHMSRELHAGGFWIPNSLGRRPLLPVRRRLLQGDLRRERRVRLGVVQRARLQGRGQLDRQQPGQQRPQVVWVLAPIRRHPQVGAGLLLAAARGRAASSSPTTRRIRCSTGTTSSRAATR